MPHPVVEAIQTGKAPRPARLAAAKGLLPMPPEDLLFALSLLAKDTDEEVRAAVPEALMHFNPEVMLVVAQDQKADPTLLTFLCTTPKIPEPVVEAVILNRATPDPAIAQFALSTQSTSLIEALTINQQRLIRNPQLIEAILHNPKRSPEAERRAREVKLEFFEKEYGKERISQEAAAQSKSTQAEAQFTVVAPPKPEAPPPPPAPVTAAPPPVPAQPVASPAAEAPKPAAAPAKPLKLSAAPPVAMIQQGKAPRPAKLMTAMGKLPLAPEDLLHAQVLLASDSDQEIATAARNSIDEKDPDSFLSVAQNREAPEEVLAYLLTWSKLTTGLGEALLINPSIPDLAVLNFARMSSNGSLLEAATINQQRLIRIPDLIDAILNNPYRTFEAERRAKEVRVEFFEKELGAARIAQEKKARAEKFAGIVDTPVSDEEFNELLSSFEADVGVSLEGISDEEPSVEDAIAAFNRMLASVKEEDLSEEDREFLTKERKNMTDSERLSIYQQLAKMSIKERIFAALKGNREVRSILIRDANKLISTGVVKNPKITDAEVEAFANIKGISEDVLRVIAMNRAWISSYNTMHNLIRNPRCPPNFSMNMMPRLQQRDLLNLSKSKGIPDMIRQAAGRLYTKRQAGKG
ncbi:MAG: hypothetical protein K1Y36_20730 [Blastocatellia bacterium]|nr:hypothetical protein [Blastocatellia bacterium]